MSIVEHLNIIIMTLYARNNVLSNFIIRRRLKAMPNKPKLSENETKSKALQNLHRKVKNQNSLHVQLCDFYERVHRKFNCR